MARHFKQGGLALPLDLKKLRGNGGIQVDQSRLGKVRQQGSGEGFGYRGYPKQGVGRYWLATAKCRLSRSVLINQLAAVDDGNGQADDSGILGNSLNGLIELRQVTCVGATLQHILGGGITCQQGHQGGNEKSGKWISHRRSYRSIRRWSPVGKIPYGKIGGAGRNRTGVYGVAVRCITTLPPRLMTFCKGREFYPSRDKRVSALFLSRVPCRPIVHPMLLQIIAYQLAYHLGWRSILGGTKLLESTFFVGINQERQAGCFVFHRTSAYTMCVKC
jgi:hypothetical protein